MKSQRLTINKINARIQERFSGIKLTRGKGYFYLYSDDEVLALKLAALHTTTISVYSLNQVTMDRWMEFVEYVLKDSERNPSDRCPVFENI
jgi:hypothetical protein